MGSYIETNDTLQITREQGFPKELDYERHKAKPYLAEEFNDKIFEFKDKPNIRVYHRPPVRNFLVENIEIKKCKNCGKFFVPEKRSDELYCNNIFENDKTCKEVGPFKVKQKLMEENNDLKVYRNVYQKLLLRTRRNPDNTQYETEFIAFKKKNAELKEQINNGEISQEEYINWLNEQ